MSDRPRGTRQLDSPSPRPRPGKGKPGTAETPRTARWLAMAVAGLIALIAISRLTRPGSAAAPLDSRDTTPAEQTPAPAAPLAASPPARRPAPVAQPPAPTPTLDLLVRLEANRRIQLAGSGVYMDSLLAESDSVLRRWVERQGKPITVAFERDSLFKAARVDERPIRAAFAAWQGLPLGVEFSFIADSSTAEVVVHWIERFDPEEKRTGETDLEVAPDGAIQHARITLSLRDPTGAVLDGAAQTAAATHEVGHALGLGHSSRVGDVMFATPRSAALSPRDRRTAELIYGLPPGSVKTGT